MRMEEQDKYNKKEGKKIKDKKRLMVLRMGFCTVSGETPYIDVSTERNDLSVEIRGGRWRMGGGTYRGRGWFNSCKR